MSTYNPDRWVIVKIHTAEGELHHRILATWYGGYTTGASWKLSSGVTGIRETEFHYEIKNTSGSLYICHKQGLGTSAYSQGIFDTYKSRMTDQDIFEIVSTTLDPLGGLPVDLT
jgi:hypothetical protein